MYLSQALVVSLHFLLLCVFSFDAATRGFEPCFTDSAQQVATISPVNVATISIDRCPALPCDMKKVGQNWTGSWNITWMDDTKMSLPFLIAFIQDEGKMYEAEEKNLKFYNSSGTEVEAKDFQKSKTYEAKFNVPLRNDTEVSNITVFSMGLFDYNSQSGVHYCVLTVL